MLPKFVQKIVEKENQNFSENLDKKYGSEILEGLTLELRSHRSKIGRNENYKRFAPRITSLLIFLEDLTYMGRFSKN